MERFFDINTLDCLVKTSPQNMEHAMYFYQIKLVIKENKVDVFVECLISVSCAFQTEKGCMAN